MNELPEECRRFFAYWDQLRGNQIVPPRSALDPGQIRTLLPLITIVELLSRSRLIIRLAGTGVRNILGFEATGKNALNLAEESRRPIRSYRYWASALQPCGVVYSREIAFSSGVTSRFLSLVLPMQPDQPTQPPIFVSIIASPEGHDWTNTSVPALDVAQDFRFIDIGAGVPASIFPLNPWPLDDTVPTHSPEKHRPDRA
ncbi:MAG TPA: PAS domain-containing protein [Aliidongia sp.]|nr:PAS domain-containing protein [Aliidongia sp.]